MTELDMFLPPDHRHPDHATAVAAAHRIRPIGKTLRAQVFDAIAQAGERGLTDLELEQLPSFRAYGFSTVRKRRSELYKQGRLVKAGERGGASVWVLAAGEQGADHA